MGRGAATKPVLQVTDKARFKPGSSATETSQNIEIQLIASLDMILYKKRQTKALIRLCGCAGWSALSCYKAAKSGFLASMPI